jgi:tetratricopeptide (TPR) repeat protein
MVTVWQKRVFPRVLICVFLLALPLELGFAQGGSDASALNEELGRLYTQGRFADAIDVARRLLTADERRLGKDHPDTLIDVNNLAELYRIQGKYREAEPLYRRALEALSAASARSIQTRSPSSTISQGSMKTKAVIRMPKFSSCEP